MKLKQVFRKVNPADHKTVKVTATDETCRDLQWFCERFPLDFDAASLRVLEERAGAFEARLEKAYNIMEGQTRLEAPNMALPPRDYQKQAAALCMASGSLLLADDLGLGKTVSAITLLSHIETLPALVVCPAHLPRQWKKELERFLPGVRVHLAKKATAYSLIDKDGRAPDVIVMSYHKLSGWADQLAGEVRTVVFDEVQELRRDSSQRYAAALHIAEKCDFRLGLSATPIYNYGIEFYNVLNALKPGVMGKKAEFLREWCVGGGYGGDDKARIEHAQVFGTFLRDSALMLRRTRADVSRELPQLSRIVQQVDHNTKPFDDFEDASLELARIIVEQQGGWAQAKASSEFSSKLRQVTGIAKAPYVAEFVRMLLKSGESVVLYGWHRAVYEIWAERLKEFDPAWYTGNESTSKKSREVERFTSGKTKLLIMSLRSGAGVDGLQHCCSTVVIGELDWSPGALDQCVGRIHRDQQTKPVFAYYLNATDGCDPYMVDALGLKRQQIEGVRDPDEDVVTPSQTDPEHIKRIAQNYLNRTKR